MVKFTYQSLKRLQVSKGFNKVSQGKRLLKFSKGFSAYVSKGLSKCFKRCQAGFWNTDFLEHRFFGKPVSLGKPFFDRPFFGKPFFGQPFFLKAILSWKPVSRKAVSWSIDIWKPFFLAWKTTFCSARDTQWAQAPGLGPLAQGCLHRALGQNPLLGNARSRTCRPASQL